MNRPAGTVKPETPEVPRGAATWRYRIAGDGGAGWQQLGAQGSADTAKIEGAQATSDTKETRIEGLQSTVQEMVDHPFANYGFALAFDAPVQFGSGQANSGRPRLELELEDAAPKTGADLSVVAIERKGNPGELATFVAHVKNVGTASSPGFSATWYVEDKPGVPQDVSKPLAPGEEATLSTQAAYRNDKSDHRFGSVALRIRPSGPDANPRNDGLSVVTSGRGITVAVSKATAAQLAPQSAEDWVQGQVRLFNDVYLAQSRFSFAPDGVRERVLVNRVMVADLGSVGDASLGDAVVQVASTDPTRFLRSLAMTIGAPSYGAESVSPENNLLSNRGGQDRFPGLMGYGDTRYEGLVPGQVGLPYEAFSNPMFEAIPIEPTGLLSATDVATLNAAFGGPAPVLPKTVLLHVQNQAGEGLDGAELQIFQTQDGKIAKDATSRVTLTTTKGGTALLPGGDSSPFAKLDPTGGNGALLIKATANGVTEWTWLKNWQLIDTASRGNRVAAIMDLRVALPSLPLESETNLAADRIVSDSAGSVPAKLAALIDGSNETEAALGGKPGDWVEIDLGRDRTVGEVDLVADPGSVWTAYDLVTYSTGQRPEEAQRWTQEVDANWSYHNRRDPLSANRVSVAYRGKPRRFRFLRIVNRGRTPGRLAEIKVIPAKVAQ
ncbi:hypothetical protein OP10G_1433 [Fimbriimonas ginsengisoli Gsoil 348]|uniref:F5/8 type C domain-containing protein n=2 Tax=Fimbriimonas ginsengisoli TaxID=1005039 RepID=A0A068NMV4_FIMGI|nr:hypothetical protein OP10G_1433 [Fimbriimonas ginsengisoli Gsoil 348]